jgi:type IV pilus assembly protein PilA
MNSKSAAALLLVTGAVMSGCGGDDEKASADKPDGAQSAQADATAKSSARTAVTELEACYVDAQDYSGCKPTTPGAELTDASATGYTLTAKSTSGNTFVITKDDAGTISRTCTTKGEAGCSAAGTW